MYGRAYLEWVHRRDVSSLIDAFLDGLDREDRVVALSVLRERHTVYKDNPLGRIYPTSAAEIQNSLLEARRRVRSRSVLSDILGR